MIRGRHRGLMGTCIDNLPVNLAVYEPDALLLQVDPNQSGNRAFHSHLSIKIVRLQHSPIGRQWL